MPDTPTLADLSSLERDIEAALAGAGDERALEAVRVAALGKKGSVSERMKRLGRDEPGGAEGRRRRR